MADTFTLYKLIILYMLDKVSFPLSNAQLSEFILEKEYTDYFTVQTALSELNETGFLRMSTVRNKDVKPCPTFKTGSPLISGTKSMLFLRNTATSCATKSLRQLISIGPNQANTPPAAESWKRIPCLSI